MADYRDTFSDDPAVAMPAYHVSCRYCGVDLYGRGGEHKAECPRSTTGSPQILDACCGGRHWWWDKAHPLAVYMDERVVPLGNEWRATWECSPDVVGDFRAMPFADESFQMVVFDPPHIIRKNLTTKWSTRFYGALNPETWQDDLRAGFAECWRVLIAGGTLVFKWSGDTSRCSPYFPADPVVGTRWKAAEDEKTSWFIFYKPLSEVASEVAA